MAALVFHLLSQLVLNVPKYHLLNMSPVAIEYYYYTVRSMMLQMNAIKFALACKHIIVIRHGIFIHVYMMYLCMY